jgi:hypothetical protein
MVRASRAGTVDTSIRCWLLVLLFPTSGSDVAAHVVATGELLLRRGGVVCSSSAIHGSGCMLLVMSEQKLLR